MPAPLLDPAIRFFTDLALDNSRGFWERERHRYDAEVRTPFLQVLDGVGGTWRVYRPHNDARFVTKEPYKTFIGAVTEREDGVGTFLQVSARGLLVGTGMPMMAPDQLDTHRAAVADARGADLEHAIDTVRRRGPVVHGGRWEPLKRVPRGHDPSHPRAELLRWKGVETNSRVATPAWSTPSQAVSAIRRLLDAAQPVDAWLARHVGPSNLTPEERFAPRRRS